MILANGCPKSGTHALMAWLSDLGLHRHPGIVKPNGWKAELRGDGDGDFVHAHVPYGIDVSDFNRVITIIRDPRNVLISYARWEHVSPIGAIENFLGADFFNRYDAFLNWRGHCVIIRYEDIICGASQPKGMSNTNTGAPSHWKQWWTPELNKAWRKAGCHELVRKAGYE